MRPATYSEYSHLCSQEVFYPECFKFEKKESKQRPSLKFLKLTLGCLPGKCK